MAERAFHAAKSAAADVAGLMLAKGVRAPLWLLISAVLARVLEPEGLGTWSMILAAAAFLNNLLLFWTHSITQRFGRGEWLSGGGLKETWAARWPLVGAGFSLALVLLCTTPFAWPARFFGLTVGTQWYVLLALITLWLMGECQGLQQVRERFWRLAWSPIIADLGFLVVLGTLWTIKGRQESTLASGFVIAVLLGMGLLSWSLWLISELRQVTLNWTLPSRGASWRAARFALPLVPGALVGYLAEWCDYFLIRYFYTEVEVGLFHPAYQYMLILVGLPTAIVAVLLPKIVASADDDGGAGVKVLVHLRSPQIITLWALVSVIMVALLPALLSLLLGPRYEGSAEFLRILLIAVPGAVVSHILGIAYFIQGRLGVSTVVFFGIKCLVNFAVSFVLLPRLGVLGSAIGSASSYVVMQWIFLIEQHRYLGLRPARGATALLLAHLSSVMLALVEDVALRLLLATVIVAGIVLWARSVDLFLRADVSALVPRRFVWAERLLARVLCRTP